MAYPTTLFLNIKHFTWALAIQYIHDINTTIVSVVVDSATIRSHAPVQSGLHHYDLVRTTVLREGFSFAELPYFWNKTEHAWDIMMFWARLCWDHSPQYCKIILKSVTKSYPVRPYDKSIWVCTSCRSEKQNEKKKESEDMCGSSKYLLTLEKH